MRLKPNCGYFDLTVYPLGGDFKRANETGLKLKSTEKMERQDHGCDTIATLENGNRIACDSRLIDFNG